MGFFIHMLKKRAAALTGRLADLALFVGIVLFGGIGSSWYMVEQGSRLTTENIGPWVTWTNAARADADPYTRAHYARLGALLMSADVAQNYVARADSEGTRLHSACDYEITGHSIATHWWSITVFDDRGSLIPNLANRYTFTSDTMAVNPDGTFTVALSRDARPGNWLPVGGAGRVTVAFSMIDYGMQTVATDAEMRQKLLPLIKKSSCR